MSIRATKLTFKGEKTKRKRKARHLEDDDDAGVGPSSSTAPREDDDTWLLATSSLEVRGPTFLYHASLQQEEGGAPVCMSFDTVRSKLAVAQLTLEDEDGGKVKEAELVPHAVAHVWVATRIAGSECVNFRTGITTSSGAPKFLAADSHGVVSADREARGPQEEWTVVTLEDSGAAGMCALQNASTGKYLSLDETAGGQNVLRADSDSIGFGERWWLKVQAKYRREAHEEQKRAAKQEVEQPVHSEADGNKIYQAWGAGRSVVSKEDKRELKKAKKEGKLQEALLDRRAKLKSDRFC